MLLQSILILPQIYGLLVRYSRAWTGDDTCVTIMERWGVGGAGHGLWGNAVLGENYIKS